MKSFTLSKTGEKLFFSSILFPVIDGVVNLVWFFHPNKRRLRKAVKKCINEKADPAKALKVFLAQVQHVPYYRKIIEQNVIDINSSDIYAEMDKFPILKREEIIANYDQIVNKEYKGVTHDIGSSGTTATSLVFPCPLERHTKLSAVWWRNRISLGIKFDSWMIWFGGNVVIPIEQNHGPYYKVNFFLKRVMFSAFHLTTDTISEYHSTLKKMPIKWIHGHAHNIVLLSTLITENHLEKLEHIKFITTGADSLFDWQRKLIQEAFPNAIIRQIYGLTEGVASICEDINGELIVDEDFAYTEFLPLDENNPELCRIVGTGFNNPAFPMIRYETGDLATVKTDENGVRHILQIDGRTVDSIKLPNGRRISSTSMTNFEYTQQVKEVQFYQEDLYNIYVRIVRRPGYDDEEEKKVIASIRERLPQEVKIHLEYVDKIERTKNGKIRYIISNVK